MFRLSVAILKPDEFNYLSLGNERGDYRFYQHLLTAKNYKRWEGNQKPNRDVLRPVDFEYLKNWVNVTGLVPESSKPRLMAILDILESDSDFWLIIERA